MLPVCTKTKKGNRNSDAQQIIAFNEFSICRTGAGRLCFRPRVHDGGSVSGVLEAKDEGWHEAALTDGGTCIGAVRVRLEESNAKGTSKTNEGVKSQSALVFQLR